MNGVLENDVMESLEALQRVLPKTEWNGTRNNPIAGCWFTCTMACANSCRHGCDGMCGDGCKGSCTHSCPGDYCGYEGDIIVWSECPGGLASDQ